MSFIPPKSTSLLIPGPAGDIEAVLDEPSATGGEVLPKAVAVVCHPHPLFGGTMTNKVAHILARTCNDLGLPALRFNFRGVGRSAGAHADGVGETEDTLAAIDWAAARWPNTPVWLLGFSFGAAMALRASLRYPVARLVTVAPALRWLTQLHSQVPACPWLIVQGDRDELVDARAVQEWAAGLSEPPTIKILAGAEHFFHGRLNDVRQAIVEWTGSE